jgi:Tol biopolymer transport system component
MTDELDFEAGLEQRLRARAALADRPFDAASIARATVTAGARRRIVLRLVWPSMRPGLVLLVLVGLLTIALLAIALAGALRIAQPPTPPTFPIATGNGWIAVSANPKDVGGGENGDIYRVEAGAATSRIIGSDGDDLAQACPRFSPDGVWLAYGEARASGAPTNFHGDWPVTERAIVISRASRRDLAALDVVHKRLPGPGQIACPEWSPDGRSVAVVVGSELWIIDAKSVATAVIPLQMFGARTPDLAWSRDGRRIAVAADNRIRVIRILDGTSEELPVQGSVPGSLAWTAGDREIVYLPSQGLETGAVRIIDLGTRQDVELTVDPPDPLVSILVNVSAVAPDGTRVAWIERTVTCTSDGSECAHGTGRVMTADLRGRGVLLLRESPDALLTGIQWSPAGDRLLLTSIDGIASIAPSPGSTPEFYTRAELNLEWSTDEVTWQPVYR